MGLRSSGSCGGGDSGCGCGGLGFIVVGFVEVFEVHGLVFGRVII